MSLQSISQAPISLRSAAKSDVRTQFAAVCYRIVKGKPEILMVTSRRAGRWIIPKGWPMDGKTPAESALIEAWEEAGVRGDAHNRCLGLYSYRKSIGPERGLPCVAMVYAIKVKSLAVKFPEKGQRRRKWMRPAKAAQKVDEPELSNILKYFDPDMLKI
ncbi:NUDIX hydrolase [Roseovarius litorisediminis]|nr:NUDIX hydrolase [Roseovarius litorisediminis]